MDGESWSSMPQVQWSSHPSGVSAQQVPEPTQTAPENPGPLHPGHTLLSSVATWHPVRAPPPRLLPHRTRRPPTQKHDPPKYSAASEVPGSRGERGFISSSEPLAAPHAPRPIPKVALIMYSQAAIISTSDQRWPCHGKQKATLRLTRAVSICEVYIKKLKTRPTKWNKCISLHVLIPISFPHANAQTFAQTFSHAPALNSLFSVITQTDYLLPPWAQIPVLFRPVSSQTHMRGIPQCAGMNKTVKWHFMANIPLAKNNPRRPRCQASLLLRTQLWAGLVVIGPNQAN